ncbi:MAG: hypothetical protein F6K31_20290 [Symploca sp. SIO2G7]|nr:hypothetical protein [Symploca sp. SIO2G7]
MPDELFPVACLHQSIFDLVQDLSKTSDRFRALRQTAQLIDGIDNRQVQSNVAASTATKNVGLLILSKLNPSYYYCNQITKDSKMEYKKHFATGIVAALIVASIVGTLPIDIATLLVAGVVGTWQILEK